MQNAAWEEGWVFLDSCTAEELQMLGPNINPMICIHLD